MKTELSVIAVALALLWLPSQGHAQQGLYAPPPGYAQPFAYAPQMMAYPGQLAAYGAQPLAPGCAAADPIGNGAQANGTSGACPECSCDPCCCVSCCCDPQWQVYGDFLYLRARDVEVAYAIPYTGPVVEELGDVERAGSNTGEAADTLVRINFCYDTTDKERILIENGQRPAGSRLSTGNRLFYKARIVRHTAEKDPFVHKIHGAHL